MEGLVMIYATISQHALKGQKLLAQGSALGNSCCSSAPCKGKSFKNIAAVWKLLPLQGVITISILSIPRVLPWVRSFCPFRAYGAYLRNLVNNLKASKMNTLALTFAICLVPATAFLIWLFTPWGKKWSKEL
ncbi:MAG: hypothetical protein EGR34_10080 [Prevotella sp.]|nr:hypothetical protein [Prevotella sp.]